MREIQIVQLVDAVVWPLLDRLAHAVLAERVTAFWVRDAATEIDFAVERAVVAQAL